jgi:hypothetical protein
MELNNEIFRRPLKQFPEFISVGNGLFVPDVIDYGSGQPPLPA